MSVNVLFIDDDMFMLKALLRTARRLEANWQLFYCDDPLRWQDSLQQQIPDIVVCDYLMPACNGNEVLGQICQQYPQTLRVLLTGDMTEEVFRSASHCAHYVLAKPYSETDLQAVFQCWRQLAVLPVPPEFRAALSGGITFAPLPAVVRALRRLLAAERVDLHQVAELLAHEPVIPARLLQLANSAFLGFQRPTHSMVECLMRLGTHLVEAVVTMMAVEHAMAFDPRLQRQINEKAFKKAMISRTLAQAAGLTNEQLEQVFIASVLSAIGQLAVLALSQYSVPASMGGFRSADLLGRYLLTLWGYPPSLLQLLADSEKPDYQHYGEPALVLALAGHICHGASADYLHHMAALIPNKGLQLCLLHWPA
jgi:HD-like signal output (HDOD) protein